MKLPSSPVGAELQRLGGVGRTILTPTNTAVALSAVGGIGATLKGQKS